MEKKIELRIQTIQISRGSEWLQVEKKRPPPTRRTTWLTLTEKVLPSYLGCKSSLAVDLAVDFAELHTCPGDDVLSRVLVLGPNTPDTPYTRDTTGRFSIARE
jgi:hypothetical protein